LANHSLVTTGALEYKQLKALRFRLTDTDPDRTVKINLTHRGKARIRIIGEDNQEYLSKEFTANTERTQNLSCSLASEPDQLYLVTLELMADPSGGVLEARNTRFEANWGDPTTLGKLVTQPVTLQEDARTVRLSWSGVGVSFMVSTDSGKTWESVENGKATVLRNPGNRLVLKAMLQMAATTQLDSYSLEVNPANFSLFTGKMLTEETGLVYFGARWYDPEVGRWITPDPAEDGENWYAFCNNNPLRYTDEEGLYAGADDLAVFISGGLVSSGIELISQAWNKNYDITKLFTSFLKGGLAAWVSLYTGPGGMAVYSFLDAVEDTVRAKLAGQGWSSDVFIQTFATDMFSGLLGGALGKGISKLAGKLSPQISKLVSAFKNRFGMVLANEKGYVNLNKLFRKVPNPWGKGGCPKHSDLVDYLANKYKDLGYKVIREYEVKGTVIKSKRYADLYVEDLNTGTKWLVQVGKQNKNGDPVSREVYAIIDFWAKGWRVKFFPYN
jgi:RHS repeat-associated protein